MPGKDMEEKKSKTTYQAKYPSTIYYSKASQFYQQHILFSNHINAQFLIKGSVEKAHDAQ